MNNISFAADCSTEAVADHVGASLARLGDVNIAVPGGRTPGPVFAELAGRDIGWNGVRVWLTDDRCVPPDHDASNFGLLQRHLGATEAAILPLSQGVAPPHFNLVWLGMGADGHTASIFPGPDMDEALNGPKERRACGVMPDPMPKDAPVARITLTKAAIAEARTVLITISGEEKKKVLEEAIAAGPSSDKPIGRLMADLTVPIDIHWKA